MTALGSGVFQQMENKRKVNEEVCGILDEYVQKYNDGSVPGDVYKEMSHRIDDVYTKYRGEIVRSVTAKTIDGENKLKVKIEFVSVDMGEELHESNDKFNL